MNTQKAVTTPAQNNSDEVMEIRRCTYLQEKARLTYDKLEYRYLPLKRKDMQYTKQYLCIIEKFHKFNSLF